MQSPSPFRFRCATVCIWCRVSSVECRVIVSRRRTATLNLALFIIDDAATLPRAARTDTTGTHVYQGVYLAIIERSESCF
eukprot:scaffold40806_cov53-Attheya_sp.AAC.5